MKKALSVVCPILSLLLLCGCTRELERTEYTVTSPVRARCVFSGTISDSAAEGTFLADGGWSFTGTVCSGKLDVGEISALPYLTDVAGVPLMGFYSGEVENALPQGEGHFVSQDTEFTGSFRGGLADCGEVLSLPLTYTQQDIAYTGSFTGSVQDGVLTGEGVFRGESGAGAVLSLNTRWENGSPIGDGTLTADCLETELCGEAFTGKYEGDCRDGIPAGQGRFSARTAEGISFTYIGEWENGLADGDGLLSFESPLYYERHGLFTDGKFTPTLSEALNTIGSREPCFALTEAQEDFLSDYADLWNCEHDLLCFDASELILHYDRTLTVRRIVQTPELLDEPDWMVLYSLRVISADPVMLSEDGTVFTCITAYDSSYATLIRLLVPQELEGLVRGRRIHAYTVPLSFSSYTTVNGETMDCLVMLCGDLVIAV